MQVYYMSGAGNDFMVIDARGMDADFEKLALALCPKTGADGFMALDDSDIADFRLHFTIPTVPGARCAATAPGAFATLPICWAWRGSICWYRPMPAL